MPHHDEFAYNSGDIAYFQARDLKQIVAELAAKLEKLEKEVELLKAQTEIRPGCVDSKPAKR